MSFFLPKTSTKPIYLCSDLFYINGNNRWCSLIWKSRSNYWFYLKHIDLFVVVRASVFIFLTTVILWQFVMRYTLCIFYNLWPPSTWWHLLPLLQSLSNLHKYFLDNDNSILLQWPLKLTVFISSLCVTTTSICSIWQFHRINASYHSV